MVAANKRNSRQTTATIVSSAPSAVGPWFAAQPQAVRRNATSGGLVPHWVLIVGKDGREYLVKDPLDSSKTVTRLSMRSEKIEAIRTFRVE